MSDLSRAQKLASAKKKLKQFQQKHRDVQSDSGRSTPSKKRPEEDGFEMPSHSENGGSTYSLSQSSNLSGTNSPVANSQDNLCQIVNGNGSKHPDIANITSTLAPLPKVSQTLFQNTLNSPFKSTPPPPQSGSDFFDNLSSSNIPSESSQQQDISYVAKSLLNIEIIKASTPEGAQFQDTPSYSFPDASFSPINNASNQTASVEISLHDLALKLRNSEFRNEELEKQIKNQISQISQLENALDGMKKGAEESSTLKDHVQAIEILVSEKTELNKSLTSVQEELTTKTGEVSELQGRLRASRHRVTDLERELKAMMEHLKTRETSFQQLTIKQSSLEQQVEMQGKRIGDLELERSELRSQLEKREDSLTSLKADLEEKNSKLDLAEIRIQQLKGGPENDSTVEELHSKNEELLKSIWSMENQLSSVTSANEDSVQEYQRYVSRLHTELQELKTQFALSEENCGKLVEREQQLVQQVNVLERQLSKTSLPAQSVDLPELNSLREQLETAEQTSITFQNQLQEKDSEMECLREGLAERALRIQELEMRVAHLQAEWPDTANLQAAIESDKVAASRAIAQNTSLKKQLEELQEAVVRLTNERDELSYQLQTEQKTNKELAACLEVANVQSEVRSKETQDGETQTLESPPPVSAELTAQLEEKVRRTMAEIADLNDEKQRLEHLVLQLQGETETIGEYVALYQVQRGMLRQRVQEKDEEVAQLARDKEALRNQLTHLNCLMQRLIGHSVTEPQQPQEHPTVIEPSLQGSANKDTADQIRSLLTEIGSSNLVTSASPSGSSNINFHPCPWCSGRLITV